jgi:hypothetical protein
VHPLAPGEARVANGTRAALRLFFLSALVGCAPADPSSLAAQEDRRYGTSVFTWLVQHEPSAVVAWRVPVDRVREILPGSRVEAAAATKVCAQAKRNHAALVLIASAAARGERDQAEDCGFALTRDAGGIVVAPR